MYNHKEPTNRRTAWTGLVGSSEMGGRRVRLGLTRPTPAKQRVASNKRIPSNSHQLTTAEQQAVQRSCSCTAAALSIVACCATYIQSSQQLHGWNRAGRGQLRSCPTKLTALLPPLVLGLSRTSEIPLFYPTCWSTQSPVALPSTLRPFPFVLVFVCRVGLAPI